MHHEEGVAGQVLDFCGNSTWPVAPGDPFPLSRAVLPPNITGSQSYRLEEPLSQLGSGATLLASAGASWHAPLKGPGRQWVWRSCQLAAAAQEQPPEAWAPVAQSQQSCAYGRWCLNCLDLLCTLKRSSGFSPTI